MRCVQYDALCARPGPRSLSHSRSAGAFACLFVQLNRNVFQQTFDDVIRCDSLTVGLERGHDAVSQDGFRNILDVFGRYMKKTLQKRPGP